jgi:subtilisin-like proprotein convertase family protein
MRPGLVLFLVAFPFFGLRAQTFSSTVGAVIPDDGTTVYFDILVSGLPDIIDTTFGLEQVCLNLNHTYNEDMNVQLQTPSGQKILLFGGVGGGEDNFTNTCLANEGMSFGLNSAPFSGTFQSFGVMGNLNNGQNPNGVWTLIIVDTYPFADEGFLIDWSITFGNDPGAPFEFTSSDLPIVKLTTLGAPIENDVKVPVLMQIIDNGAGNRNFPTQTNYAYEGTILTEWQGFTGPIYPKKNYDFDLIDEDGNKIDASLLGLPPENDWIFKAEYLDRSLIKNTLSYEMARRMGRYAPRTAPCEIILDGEYIGVYFLTEKVKRGANRVDIAKLTSADTAGVDLTGGYIFEMNINGGPANWISAYLPINFASNMTNVEFKYVYPKASVILPQQAAYIKNYTDRFEDILNGPEFMHPDSGYRKVIDVSTFIDFLIVNEFSMNYDSYGRSTYLFKEKDTDGGLLKIGPPWDYDRAFDYFRPEVLDLWVWERTQDVWPFPFWWSRLWEDPSYRHQLVCRWDQLRETTLNTQAFNEAIDSLELRLSESQQRNFRIWNDLGALSFQEHYDTLKNFLARRLEWIDATLAVERPIADFSAVQNGPNEAFWSFIPNDTTALKYFWDFGDGDTSILQNPVHQYVAGGTYPVKLTIQYGLDCSISTQQVLDFVYLDIPSHQAAAAAAVFPNPFSDRIFIKNAPKSSTYTLSNTFGQVIYSGKTIEKQDFSNLPSGVYFLQINDLNVFKLYKKEE